MHAACYTERLPLFRGHFTYIAINSDPQKLSVIEMFLLLEEFFAVHHT